MKLCLCPFPFTAIEGNYQCNFFFFYTLHSCTFLARTDWLKIRDDEQNAMPPALVACNINGSLPFAMHS